MHPLKTGEKYHHQDVHMLHAPKMLVPWVGSTGGTTGWYHGLVPQLGLRVCTAGRKKQRPEMPEFASESLLFQSPNSVRARSRNAQTWGCKGRAVTHKEVAAAWGWLCSPALSTPFMCSRTSEEERKQGRWNRERRFAGPSQPHQGEPRTLAKLWC